MKSSKPKKYVFAVSSELPNKLGVKTVVEPGRAHYSYRTVRDKFCDMLNEHDENWIDILRPEIYRNFNLGSSIFSNFEGEKVHLTFKPAEYARTAGGFRNIAHVAWEFDQLRSKYATQPVLPANDDLRMLSAFDQVWVGCEFTKKVFNAHGLNSVFTVPAPIKIPRKNLTTKDQNSALTDLGQIKALNIKCYPLSIRNHGFLYSQGSIANTPSELSRVLKKPILEGGKVFLQILNPHDSRKNLKKTVKAFHAFHYKNPNTVLILKLTSPEKDESIYEIMRWFIDDSHALDASGVYFTTNYIPEADKATFLRLFDYYVSPSRAEGQNLPLQEAMACGLIPITTKNTAMIDYIDDTNAIVIPSKPTEVTHLCTSDASIWGFEWHDCTEIDIYNAFNRAVNLSPAEIKSKQQAAINMIEIKYSYSAVATLMHNALSTQSSAR